MNLPIPPLLENVFILCGTNNIWADFLKKKADCIVNTDSYLHERSISINVFVC